MIKPSILIWLSRPLVELLLAIMLYGCAATPGREQPLGYVVSSAFSSDGRFLAVSSSEGEVALFDARPLWFRRIFTREADKTPIQRDYLEMIAAVYRPRPLAFSPDGVLLAASGVSGNVVVWDVASGMEKFRSPLSGQIVDLFFSPDGQTLISAGPDVIVRSVGDGGNAIKVELPTGAKATAASISPDGFVLAVGLSNGAIAMFDARNLKLLRVSKEHEAPVTGIAFQRKGEAFASTAGGYDLRLWKHSPEGGFEKGALPVSAAVSATETIDSAQGVGALLWLLGTIRGFQIVGAPTLGAPPIIGGAASTFSKAARTVPPHCGSRVAFSANGRYLVSTANLMMCPDCIGTLAPAFMLFSTDLETGATTTVRDLGCEVAIAPDGRTFATAGPGAPQIRDSATGKQLPQN
ncbi:WD40 repeat domain-containing protein [Propionivibrio sp.]|uniref:WD40 repeat domain-containing protein n=1 Tax=Propionivibrio sp. TaxID=2212460 RepID=UPI0026320917|nr:WD40 repeat domain-containing protein [Propionivibrio sp.]